MLDEVVDIVEEDRTKSIIATNEGNARIILMRGRRECSMYHVFDVGRC